MLNDLGYCIRTLTKSPGLAAVAILSLGLGIGLNLTVFGIFESLFLRGVTAEDPAHTFHVWIGGSNRASYPNFRDLRQSGVAPFVSAYSLMQFSLGAADRRERIYGQSVAGDYFEMLGVQPFLGRRFNAEEKDVERGSRVAILSYPFWLQRFGADRTVLGKTLRLNGEPFTIVGVLPEGYRSIHGFATEPPFYVPYSRAVDPNCLDRNGHPLELAIRTAPGTTRQQATASLLSVIKRLERLYPEENRNLAQVRVFGLSIFDQLGRENGQKTIAFFVILGVLVGLILLIACANVAGILVARAVNRRREIAIRLAIGGTRKRLLRLFFAEGFVLACAGLCAASLIYVWAVQVVEHLRLPLEVPVYLHPELNWRVALYCAAVALAAALLCSVAPALEASKANVSSALKNEGDAAARGRIFSLRNSLVIGQVAVSLLLLVTSLLFVRSLLDVETVNPGFNVANQLLVSIALDAPAGKRNLEDNATRTVMERLSKMPGVRSVSDAFIVPLSHSSWMTSVRIGNELKSQPVVQANAVGLNYFATTGIALLAGRDFSAGDSKTAPAVALVNKTFAKRFFDGKSPLGQVVSVPRGRGESDVSWEIVGVVADSKHLTLGEGPTPVIYRPLTQEPLPFSPTIHVRTVGPASQMTAAVRSVVRAAVPSAVVDVKTMSENLELSTYPNKIGAAMLGVMGALGLVLASIGLYGVLAYTVSRRIREIGVRIALGASAAQVLRIVLGQAMALAGIGVAIGLALSLVSTRALATFLSAGVSVTDPITLAAVVGILAVTALSAAFVPAMRAVKIDPIAALRYE